MFATAPEGLLPDSPLPLLPSLSASRGEDEDVVMTAPTPEVVVLVAGEC